MPIFTEERATCAAARANGPPPEEGEGQIKAEASWRPVRPKRPGDQPGDDDAQAAEGGDAVSRRVRRRRSRGDR